MSSNNKHKLRPQHPILSRPVSVQIFANAQAQRNGPSKRPAEPQDANSDDEVKAGPDNSSPMDVPNNLYNDENPTITITAIRWCVALQAIQDLTSHEIALPPLPSIISI